MKKKLHNFKNLYSFYCPGCERIHQVNNKWKINISNLTISPSILVTSPKGSDDRTRCHSYIKEGKIQYLGDCNHKFRGVTIPMIEFEMSENGDYIDPFYEDFKKKDN